MNQDQVSRIAWYSVALMLLTSVHHAFSIPVIIVTLALNYVLKKKGVSASSFLFWAFYLITLVPSVAMIGVFEGIYNHIIKNVLFFGGLSESALHTLFPPPTYEMPNDLLFEITGMLQGIIVIPMIIRMIQLTFSMFTSKQPALK